MRYLGGKYRIRKWLAENIAPYRTPGHILWEPFCGGLNASEALLPDICSDVDESLTAFARLGVHSAERNGVGLRETLRAKWIF